MYFSRLLERAVSCRVRAAHNPLLPGLAVVALLASAPYAHAQASSGVTGTVTDASGAVVPNANVSIVEDSTQTKTDAVTGSAGTYAVTGLTPGRYTVTVASPGFATVIKHDVNVEITTQATIDFTLNAGASETVTVSSPLITLNTTQPELGTTIEPQIVKDLPVSIGGGRGRQISSLATHFPAASTAASTLRLKSFTTGFPPRRRKPPVTRRTSTRLSIL